MTTRFLVGLLFAFGTAPSAWANPPTQETEKTPKPTNSTDTSGDSKFRYRPSCDETVHSKKEPKKVEPKLDPSK